MGVRASLRTNADKVFADLDAYAQAIHEVAAPRAANKLAEQAQTAGLREINRVYSIGPRVMERYVTTKLAGNGVFKATLTAIGRGFPVYVFKARQTKAGVTAQIKGRRVLFKHAFIAQMPNGHVGVFARGGYGGKGSGFRGTGEAQGRFKFGRGRLPIQELYTLSPPDAFGNPDVVQAMQDRVQEQAPKVLSQEIRFATRGA